MVGKDDIPYRMENHPVMFETTLTIPTNAFQPSLYPTVSRTTPAPFRVLECPWASSASSDSRTPGASDARSLPGANRRSVVLFLRNVYGIYKIMGFLYGIDRGKLDLWGLHGVYMGLTWDSTDLTMQIEMEPMWPTCDNMWPTSPNIHDN